MLPSQRHKGQTYWTLEKAPSLQWDQEGNIVDPNDTPEAVPEAPTSDKKGK
jgi:hypothetical protein